MVTTKINANIGASPVSSGTAEEVEKLQWAQTYGADSLMDLSTGGDLRACRQAIIDHATIPIGTEISASAQLAALTALVVVALVAEARRFST